MNQFLSDAHEYIDNHLQITAVVKTGMSLDVTQDELEEVMSEHDADILVSPNGKMILIVKSFLSTQVHHAREALWEIFEENDHAWAQAATLNAQSEKYSRKNLENTFRQFSRASRKSLVYLALHGNMMGVLHMWVRARVIADVMKEKPDLLFED